MTAATTTGDANRALELVPDLRFASIGADLLVFDVRARRAHLLNAAAAAVLAAIDGSSIAATARRLATDYGVDAPTMELDVATVVEELLEQGLLVDAGTSAAPAEVGERADLFPPHLELPAGFGNLQWPHTIGPFRALHVDVDIACTDPVLARHLDRVLRPLRADVTPTHRYRIATVDDAGRAVLADHWGATAFDDRVGDPPSTPGRAAAWLLWHLNQLASTTATHNLQLHAAGAADRRGRIAAFPAEMNSGKSTLVAGLVQRGLDYVTDETVSIDPASRLVIPYPKPIALDPGSWAVLPELEPDLPDGEEQFSHQKWYVDPESVRPGSLAGPGPLRLVVFPSYRPDEPTTLTPLDAREAAMALAGCCFNLDRAGQAGLELLAEIATQVPAYRLSVHDLESGCAAVLDLLTRIDEGAP